MSDIKVKITPDTAGLLQDVEKTVGKVNANLKQIDGSAAAKGMKQLGNETRDAGNQAESAAKKYKSFLSELKGEAGKGSLLGQSLKLAAGGGAIAGVGLAAREFTELTAGIANFSNKLRSGKENTAELTREFVQTIPILGKVEQGFENIGEAITGEKAAMDKAARQVEQMNKQYENQVELLKERQKIAKQDRDELRSKQDELAIAKLPKSQQEAARLKVGEQRKEDERSEEEKKAHQRAETAKTRYNQAVEKKKQDDAFLDTYKDNKLKYLMGMGESSWASRTEHALGLPQTQEQKDAYAYYEDINQLQANKDQRDQDVAAAGTEMSQATAEEKRLHNKNAAETPLDKQILQDKLHNLKPSQTPINGIVAPPAQKQGAMAPIIINQRITAYGVPYSNSGQPYAHNNNFNNSGAA